MTARFNTNVVTGRWGILVALGIDGRQMFVATVRFWRIRGGQVRCAGAAAISVDTIQAADG